MAAVKHVANMVEALVCLGAKGVRSNHRAQESWHPPEEGWVKVNSDGTFEVRTRNGSGVAVVRDHLGQVQAAQARWQGQVDDALMVEALAARDGLELAHELGYTQVILEMDNSTLVNALKVTMADRSRIAGLWHDIRELDLFLHFKCVGFDWRRIT
ncbi:uncharacterized protein [Setaria viridis]|uniref:uncharacterized protein n=1 Tax=Setaria viridis TaxID=4556 RepID=UPI0014935BD4|nr:uncharacterized protein LOC117856516 [Setaria viridis]